jgi:ABC-2 type transport system permease protein
VWRSALNAGTVAYGAFIVILQTVLIVLLAVALVQLPLTFLSAALMAPSLLPGWIRMIARFNPVNWAVEAARSAAMQTIDWGLVAGRLGLLVALLMVSAAAATRAFARYQRSL